MPQGFNISIIEVDDSAQSVGTALIKAGKSINTLKPTMESIWDDMRLVAFFHIQSQGRRAGGSWKQLTPRTIERKDMAAMLYTVGARAGYSSIGGDALVDSVTQEGAEFQIREVSNTEAVLGTDRPYAAGHQFGISGRKTGALPKRPFLQYKPSDIEKWSGMITAHLLSALSKNKGAP